jgi:hypothetical protein
MCARRGEKPDQATLDLLEEMDNEYRKKKEEGYRIDSVSDEGIINWISKEDWEENRMKKLTKLKKLSEELTEIYNSFVIE